MSQMKKLTLINWGVLAVIFLIFLSWHGAFEGALSDAEVNDYVAKYEDMYPGKDAATVRAFLEKDDGKPVVMVNPIKVYDQPIEVNGKNFGDSAEAALDEYMGFVGSYLIKRGSYPLYIGLAELPALEHWGIENATDWDSIGLVRYRSRRVMMEMVTDPAFDAFHDAKIAAIEKTFSYPVSTLSSTGSLSVTVGMILLSLALIIQLVINRINKVIRGE